MPTSADHDYFDVAAASSQQESAAMTMRRGPGAADGSRSLAGRLDAALGRHGAAVPPITLEETAEIERCPGSMVTPVKLLARLGGVSGT